MDMRLISTLFLYAIFIGAVVLVGINHEKYAKYRKEAFLGMKRMRMFVYCVPLLVSVIFVIGVYQKYFDPVIDLPASVLAVGLGIYAWLLLFDAFESKRVKQSKSEQK
ncbi:MAG: hypothetical protein LBJ20_02530 [Candidatus Methanoplasma sp.]|jgi:hypothetical protein|nr:hypothetical protein [Candidatus Methanoplasma sp.]